MKKISLLGILLTSLLNTAYAADEVAPPAMLNGNFCLFATVPPPDFKYTVIKEVKVSKGSYGGVADMIPALVGEARGAGADAIIHYAGSQRFGFFPWRLVRPVVRGTAIKWDSAEPVDCAKLGGTTMQNVIATNRAPEQ